MPHSASGGYAQYSQLLAPRIEEALKADDLRIEHHSGAGGILGSNLVWHAEPDGLTIGLSSGSSLMLASLVGGEGVQFDATEFTYLGRPTADDRIIFVGKDSPIQSMQDVIALDRPFKVPSQGVDDDFYAMAMLADTLGFEVEFITGYEGGADTTLAVIKGDGDGRLTSWPSATSMLQAGEVRPILTIGEERHPDYPDVPTALELVSDPEKQETLQALMNIQSLHRTFFGPPGIPPEVADEMRAADHGGADRPRGDRAGQQPGSAAQPHGRREAAGDRRRDLRGERRDPADPRGRGRLDPVASQRPGAPVGALHRRALFCARRRHDAWRGEAADQHH